MLEQFYKDNERILKRRVVGRGIRLQDAEDVLQESCARALHYADTFRDGQEYGAWFNTIMNNAISDHKADERLQGMARNNIKTLGEVEELSPEDISFKAMMCDSLEKELLGRSKLHRDVLYLYFIKEVQVRDIVKITDANRGTVKTILDRFKKEMRSKYE